MEITSIGAKWTTEKDELNRGIAIETETGGEG
jgi:hypothetical protein